MRLTLTLTVATATAILTTGAAMADQCAWIDKAQATKLEQLEAAGFNGAKSLVRFCAPCGDTSATVEALDPAKKFVLKAEDEAYSSITYGTESVDLAYWYLANETALPVNGAQSLAVLAGCPVSEDTPKAVNVGGDGKAVPAP